MALLPTVEHDQTQLEQLKQRAQWVKRKYRPPKPAVSEHRPVTIFLSPDFLRSIRAKGAAALYRKLTPKQRSAKARKAARARWSRVTVSIDDRTCGTGSACV